MKLFVIGWVAVWMASALWGAGTLVTERIESVVLRENRTGLDPNRTVKVYLPPGYAQSEKRYAVVYFFHSINGSAEKVFEDGNMVRLLERGFTQGVVPEFIFVVADYSSPTMGSWFENSPTSGRWLDFTVEELVPFIDGKFRTIARRENRGVVGDFMGAYGALKFAMLYPELFSVAYGLHPVGTGTGLMPTQQMVNWPRLHAAKAFGELWGDHYAPGFVAMAQAYLPNAERPPFYCDFIVEMEEGEPVLKVENKRRLEERFHLDELLREHGDNMRRLRGLAFDWGRYDTTQGHVYSNQAFTRKLDQLGIEHVAEEYNGGAWDKNWTEDGRFATRVLPFLARCLSFE
jgi:Enterochelin esterase and related enzymes